MSCCGWGRFPEQVALKLEAEGWGEVKVSKQRNSMEGVCQTGGTERRSVWGRVCTASRGRGQSYIVSPKSQSHPEPQNVILLGNRIFADRIT